MRLEQRWWGPSIQGPGENYSIVLTRATGWRVIATFIIDHIPSFLCCGRYFWRFFGWLHRFHSWSVDAFTEEARIPIDKNLARRLFPDFVSIFNQEVDNETLEEI